MKEEDLKNINQNNNDKLKFKNKINNENSINNNLKQYAVNSDDRNNWIDELTSKKNTPLINTKANNNNFNFNNHNDNVHFNFDLTESKNDKNLINDTIDNTIE